MLPVSERFVTEFPFLRFSILKMTGVARGNTRSERAGGRRGKLLRARVKKCVTVLGKERLSSFCTLACKFECSIHNFGGPFQAVMDEQCIELNRWHGGTPQSIILSHGFTFHHLVNPHTHIRTCTWSARNISGCEKEAS